MKKSWIVLLVLLVAAGVFAVALTQGGKPLQPEEPLALARAKMSEIGSMRFAMKMNMDVSVFLQEMDLDLAMEGEMTAEPSVVHGWLTVVMGQEEPDETEVYIETVNGETVTYVGIPADGGQEWAAQRSEASGLQSDTMELLELVSFAAETEPEQLSETELRYTGVIPAEKIRLALKAAGMLPQLEESGMLNGAMLEQISGELEDLPITVTVDQAQQVITGYRLDMTSVVRQLLLASLEESMAELGLGTVPEEMLEVTSAVTEMRLFDFGLVEPIVIPSYVKQ